MAQSNEEKYVVMATKVSPLVAERVDRIAAKTGMTKYEIVQMMLDTIVRYMDDRHNLTTEMELAMSIFEHMVGWKDALNLADPTAQMEVGEATYYMQDALGKKKGVRAVHVEKPFFGTWSQTENIQTILERTLCLLLPERYVRMRGLAAEMGCASQLEMIDRLVDMHSDDADVRAYREAFEDADRSDYGRKPVDAPYRRKLRKDIDSPTLFNNNEE